MTQPRILYSSEARDDLLALEAYIATYDGEARAELILGRLDETIANLAYAPGQGVRRRYLRRDALIFPVAPWLIVYTPLPELDGILVVRVVDGRRDLRAVLARPKKQRQRKKKR